MSYLIDTTISSEIRKGARCDARVSAWYASITDADIFLSTLVLGEIREASNLLVPAMRARPRRSNAGCGTSRPHSMDACWASTTPCPINGVA